MNRPTTEKTRWLPLALVPLFSVAVMAGCSSSDDNGGTTTPITTAIAGDADGSGVPDAFESIDTMVDTNGNGIADQYEQPADDLTSAADANNNGVDDSFEVALTSGTDANADGVDDTAAATLAGATVPDPDGGGTTDPDPDGGGTTDPDPDGGGTTDPDPDGGGTTNPDPNGGTTTGNIVTVVGQNDAPNGTADLNWDGSNLTGTLTVAEGTQAATAGIYAGIAAAGGGSQVIQMNGTAPNFEMPTNLSADQSSPILENIDSGNLYVNITTTTGENRTGQILLPGVQPKFVNLQTQNAVPEVEGFSNGAGFINVNTDSGQFTVVVNVNLNASDVDANGDAITISAAHIHTGSSTENGQVIVTLLDSGDGTRWSATGILSAADLAEVTSGNTYINVHAADDSGFMRGQIDF